MKAITCATWGGVLTALLLTSPVEAEDARLGQLQLLKGYKHQIEQGFDSLVGKIVKPDGLEIYYEIGAVRPPNQPRLGGQFSDRAKLSPQEGNRWYLEQTVQGQPVHLAYRNDGLLLVSYPQQGMNFSVTVRSGDEMAEALLMILTYSKPVEK